MEMACHDAVTMLSLHLPMGDSLRACQVGVCLLNGGSSVIPRDTGKYDSITSIH